MKTLIFAAAALIAAPALAQTANPPAHPAMQAAPGHEHGRAGRMHRAPMFQNMSPEGRKILTDAMRGTQEDRASVAAARDRINTLVGADRLDTGALKRAMSDERRLVDGQHAKRQEAMLAAVQKLSVEDRKAFAADASKARADVERRTAEWRKRAEDRRKGGRNMPPSGGTE